MDVCSVPRMTERKKRLFLFSFLFFLNFKCKIYFLRCNEALICEHKFKYKLTVILCMDKLMDAFAMARFVSFSLFIAFSAAMGYVMLFSST